MNDQNRMRLDRIAARYARRAPEPRKEAEVQVDLETDAAFLATFARVRDTVLRPVMAEIGVQLEEAGYAFRISPGGEEGAPAVDFQIIIPERGDSKDTVRFFAHKDAARGWQVIAELELKRSPVELARFESTEEVTHNVAEHLIVDAVEQMFASTGEPPRNERVPHESASVPAPQAAPQASAESDERTEEAPPVPIGEPGAGPRAGALFELMSLSAPAPAPALPRPAASEARWARWAGIPPGAAETEDVDVRMFRKAPLPFDKGAPSPTFFAAADLASADARSACGSAAGHETAALPAVDAVDAPTLTLQQYASLCAELATFPNRAAAIFERYSLSNQHHRLTVDLAWQERLRRNTAEYQGWKELYHRWVEHFEQRRRRGS